MSHDPASRTEELLLQVLVGERERGDAEVAALRERDDDFRHRLDELVDTAGRLAAAAELEREVLAECSLEDDPLEDALADVDLDTPVPGEEQVERVIRRLIAEDDAPSAPGASGTPRVAGTTASAPVPERRSFPLALVIPLLGAAAAVLIWFQLGGDPTRPASPDPDLILGEGDLELLAPVGGGADFTLFRWRHELEPGQRFELRILDAATGDELIPPVLTEEPVWRAEADSLAGWPNEIAWEVSVVSVLNEIERTSARVRASR